MPKENESTMKWKVDITNLKKAMQDAKRSIKEANAEFKTATAGMDKWSKSTDGLEAKLNQLNKTLPQQRAVLAQLEKQYDLTAANMGENSKEAHELRIQIEEQRATITKTETNIKKYNDQLSKMRAEEERSETALGKLNKTIEDQQQKLDDLKLAYQNAVVQYGATSKEARELARQIQYASRELADNKQKASDAADAAEDFDESLEDAGDTADNVSSGGFTVLKGALANLVADGFRKAIDAAKEFAKTMIDEAATVRAQASQFEQTFGDMGDEAEAAINRVADASGILNTRLKPTAAQIYAFARASGAEVPEALELMESALQASADGAAYYDRSLEDTSETLQSFLKGNFANDAALGVSATEFTRNAKATELFGKKYNELTEIQKQQTLLKMVTDAQKVSGAMGQAAREADGWENVQGNLNETWRQFKAQVGTPFLENLIPIIQAVTKSFQEWSSKVDWKKFSKTVNDVVQKIKTGFNWVIDHRKEILDTLKAIAVAFVTYKAVSIITNVITAFTKFNDAIKSGKSLMDALNLSMKANPAALLAAAVAGLLMLTKAYNKSVQEGIEAQYGLNKADQEAIDKIKEMADQYKTLDDARKDAMNSVNAEFGYLNDLKSEYNGLIDSNGKVKKGYEDRATFILTKLAEAMGMELDDIQKLIDQNGKLGDSIDEVIRKKQAEALLSANDEIYNEAIKNRSSALNDLTEAQKALDSAEKTYIDTSTEAQKVWDNYYDMMKYAPDAAAEYLEANNTIILGNEEARKSYNEAKQAVSDAEGAWIGYNSVIQNYEGLAAAIISGDSDKIQEAMRNMQNGFLTAETGNRESLERQVQNYKDNLAALEKAIEDGTPSVTQDMVDQAKSMVDAAEKELDKLPPEASKKGKKASEDFAEGVGSEEKEAEDEGKKLAKAAVKGAGSENGEKGGAKKSGENFGEGYANGMKSESILTKVGNAAKGLAKRALAWLRREQQEGSPSKLTRQSGVFFGEGYEQGILSMIAPIASAAGSMAKQAAKALGSHMGDQMRAMGAENANSWMTGFNSADISSAIGNLKANMSGQNSSLMTGSSGSVGTVTGSNQQIVTFNQTINSPKAVDRLTLYRETNSLLFSAKVRLSNV